MLSRSPPAGGQIRHGAAKERRKGFERRRRQTWREFLVAVCWSCTNGAVFEGGSCEFSPAMVAFGHQKMGREMRQRWLGVFDDIFPFSMAKKVSKIMMGMDFMAGESCLELDRRWRWLFRRQFHWKRSGYPLSFLLYFSFSIPLFFLLVFTISSLFLSFILLHVYMYACRCLCCVCTVNYL